MEQRAVSRQLSTTAHCRSFFCLEASLPFLAQAFKRSPTMMRRQLVPKMPGY